MLKKFAVGIAALAAVGFAGSAMAQISNPWTNDGAEVGVEIEVGALGEVWSTMGTDQARNGAAAPTLAITNAGGTIPPTGIATDTLNHYANVNYQVSVGLNGDIPEFTRFHVLVGVTNRGAYNAVGAGLPGQTDAVAATTITWDRRDSGTGYVGNGVNGPSYSALTGTASTTSNATMVDYAADAIHGLPPLTSATPVEVVWTIAQN